MVSINRNCFCPARTAGCQCVGDYYYVGDGMCKIHGEVDPQDHRIQSYCAFGFKMKDGKCQETCMIGSYMLPNGNCDVCPFGTTSDGLGGYESCTLHDWVGGMITLVIAIVFSTVAYILMIVLKERKVE